MSNASSRPPLAATRQTRAWQERQTSASAVSGFRSRSGIAALPVSAAAAAPPVSRGNHPIAGRSTRTVTGPPDRVTRSRASSPPPAASPPRPRAGAAGCILQNHVNVVYERRSTGDHTPRQENQQQQHRRRRRPPQSTAGMQSVQPRVGRGRRRRKWVVDDSARPRIARMKIPCDGGCGVKKVFRMIEQRGRIWRRIGKPYLDYSESDYLLDSSEERPSREDCESEMLTRDRR